MAKNSPLTPVELGTHCLGYLAEHPGELHEFMVMTGTSPDALQKAAEGGGLSAGLIDYFASNESLLIAFCSNRGLSPEAFMRVWAQLNPAG
jgi:hypothetical protein